MSIFTISRKSYDGISGIDIFVYKKIKRLSNSKISSSTNLEFFRIMRASCNLSTFLKIDQFPLINFIYYKIFREGGLWLGNAIWNSTQELIQYYNSLPGNLFWTKSVKIWVSHSWFLLYQKNRIELVRDIDAENLRRQKGIKQCRSSHQRCSVKKGVLRNFAKFTFTLKFKFSQNWKYRLVHFYFNPWYCRYW